MCLQQTATTMSQMQEELRRQNMREVAAAILEGQPLEEIARLITGIVAQRLCVERVGLYMRDVRGLIVPMLLRNISPEYGRDISRLIPLLPFVNRSTATGLPVFARDVHQDPQVSPELTALYRRENITSLLIMMLQYEQRFAGTLVVYAEPDREFTARRNLYFSRPGGYGDAEHRPFAASAAAARNRHAGRAQSAGPRNP